jgi:hypothetical protein
MDGISEEAIREHAHRIWIEEGMPAGKDLEHWERARRELEATEHGSIHEGEFDRSSADAIESEAAERGADAAITGVDLPSGRNK